jgi:hypothetical protein
MDANNPLTVSAIVSIIAAVVTVIGAAVSIYKAKPEKNHIEAQSQASLADAAESVASGAKVSSDLLLKRIKELDDRMSEREKEWKKRFDELSAELADYQDWARRLVHQVKSRGDEPVPFKVRKADVRKA